MTWQTTTNHDNCMLQNKYAEARHKESVLRRASRVSLNSFHFVGHATYDVPNPNPFCWHFFLVKVLGMFTGDEVECMVCGKAEVDVDLLEVNMKHADSVGNGLQLHVSFRMHTLLWVLRFWRVS